MIVAGYDPSEGGQVYGCPIGGTMVKESFALDGSGSTYIWGYCDSHFKCAFEAKHTRRPRAAACLGEEGQPAACAVAAAVLVPRCSACRHGHGMSCKGAGWFASKTAAGLHLSLHSPSTHSPLHSHPVHTGRA